MVITEVQVKSREIPRVPPLKVSALVLYCSVLAAALVCSTLALKARALSSGTPHHDWNTRFVSARPRQNLGTFFGGGDFPVYVSSAPLPSLSGTTLIQTASAPNGVDLLLRPEAGVSVNHKPIQPRDGNTTTPGHAKLALVYLNPPGSGVPIALKLSGSSELGVSVVDVCYGVTPGERPWNIVPSPQIPTDCALIRRTFQFSIATQSGKDHE